MNVNSVSLVKPYSVISDDATQQPINTNPKSVNFKGAIGDSLLKEVTTSKTVPSIDTVLSRIKGTFGLNADKTKDVLESFRNMIEKLVHAKNDLALKNHNANNVIQSLKEQVQKLKSEKDELIISMREMIAAKDKTHADEMFAKNKEIADLNKYADMVKVKSVEEIGVIMP